VLELQAAAVQTSADLEPAEHGSTTSLSMRIGDL
jgi:hypothetical protein